MTNDSLIELLPCPFCGGKPKLTSAVSQGGIAILLCSTPECYVSKSGKSDEDAIAAWNTRAHPTPDRSLIELLSALESHLVDLPTPENIHMQRKYLSDIRAHSASIQTPPVSIVSGDDVYKPAALPQDRVEAVAYGIARAEGREHEMDDDAHLANYIREAKAALAADEAWRKASQAEQPPFSRGNENGQASDKPSEMRLVADKLYENPCYILAMDVVQSKCPEETREKGFNALQYLQDNLYAGEATDRKAAEGAASDLDDACIPSAPTPSPAPDRYNAEPVLHQSLNLSAEMREKVVAAIAELLPDTLRTERGFIILTQKARVELGEKAVKTIAPYVAAWRAGE